MLEREREQVAAVAGRLAAAGLVVGASGNVSARAGERVAITAGGAALAELEPEQVVVVSLDGEVLDGDLAPTSEIELHLEVYRRFGTGAVVHTHAPMATALSCILDELPCIHYEMLLLGGGVRVAQYATFGTPELARNVVDALEGRTAALISNHGAVTHGPDLSAAERATELLEWAANVYWRARAVGTPRLLDEHQQRAVLEAARARGYGNFDLETVLGRAERAPRLGAVEQGR
jgi:L-fuculose-phosphate aldolase